MGVLLFCDVDGNGKITESIVGARVVPMKQYDYFFYIADKDAGTVVQGIPDYRIVDGELTEV
ncbi:hypothetical protein [Bacillus sp. 03113]|uniref:hypothetical protein n=1 Tax=Bacillus sp. 03113 TaxID=2578211 RepID=UPI0011430487|nr:hypothetical protein [Bacillus sp. 03113]